MDGDLRMCTSSGHMRLLDSLLAILLSHILVEWSFVMMWMDGSKSKLCYRYFCPAWSCDCRMTWRLLVQG